MERTHEEWLELQAQQFLELQAQRDALAIDQLLDASCSPLTDYEEVDGRVSAEFARKLEIALRRLYIYASYESCPVDILSETEELVSDICPLCSP